MGKNLVEKILTEHTKDGEYIKGNEIGIKIDQTLTQDATGTMAYLQLESMQPDSLKTELSVSYVDHNTIQTGFENADDHRYLQTVAEKYGIIYSKAGNGICHQLHLERFAKPGKTLLGSDSHTPTCGGIGMIAIGAGGLDVAVAMNGGPFYLTCPKVYKVNLTGQLKPWVTAKDVILKMLDTLSTKGNVGVVLEYGGEGVRTLTVPERATITNMGAEMGVTTSVFPSDTETKKFMVAQNRSNDWIELKADKDAEYDRVINLNLSEIEPLMACPHSPGNIKKVKELAGTKVDQVIVGSCTNSSYKDMATVATILRKHKIHPNISFGIAPGSRQVLQMITNENLLTDILNAGARIFENACGFCIGNSQSPQTEAVSIRTSNRNFEGRSGTKSAQVYLSSPETAIASAIKGEITDPRDLSEDYPDIKMPEHFLIDDSMFLKNSPNSETKIYRGPNIGEPPSNKPIPKTIQGEVAIKVGDKITTDHIMPAGQRLKYRSNVPKYSEYVFESIDDTFPKRCLENKSSKKDNIIVAGESYGQGSSREHAALCPMYLGVKSVVAKSFERIHYNNLINFGIAPLTFANPKDYEKIEQGDEIEIPNIKEAISNGENATLKIKDKNVAIKLEYNLSDRQKVILNYGGLLAYTKEKSK